MAKICDRSPARLESRISVSSPFETAVLDTMDFRTACALRAWASAIIRSGREQSAHLTLCRLTWYRDYESGPTAQLPRQAHSTSVRRGADKKEPREGYPGREALIHWDCLPKFPTLWLNQVICAITMQGVQHIAEDEGAIRWMSLTGRDTRIGTVRVNKHTDESKSRYQPKQSSLKSPLITKNRRTSQQ